MVRVIAAGFDRGSFLETLAPLLGLNEVDAAIAGDQMMAALANGPVLVIHPGDRAVEVQRRVELLSAALDRPTLVTYGTDLPPLAGSVLSSLAAALGVLAPAAATLASALPALERELVPLAWLGTVARLRSPRPRLLDRLRSSLPGGAFVVRAGAEPAVLRGGHDRRLSLDDVYPQAHVAVTTGGPEAGRWLGPRLAEAFGGAPLSSVPPTSDGPAWWGTGRLVEAVAYPIDVAVLADDLFARARPCRWCGAPVLGAPCPACGHRLPPADLPSLERATA